MCREFKLSNNNLSTYIRILLNHCISIKKYSIIPNYGPITTSFLERLRFCRDIEYCVLEARPTAQ